MVLRHNSGSDCLEQQLRKGAHLSARHRTAFFRAEVLDQVHKSHLLVLPLFVVRNLPNQWLSPAACIPQKGRCDRPIYDYTYSGLNKAVVPSAPHDTMQFCHTLPCLLHRIVNADPRIGLVFLSKTTSPTLTCESGSALRTPPSSLSLSLQHKTNWMSLLVSTSAAPWDTLNVCCSSAPLQRQLMIFPITTDDKHNCTPWIH